MLHKDGGSPKSTSCTRANLPVFVLQPTTGATNAKSSHERRRSGCALKGGTNVPEFDGAIIAAAGNNDALLLSLQATLRDAAHHH
jgi:hypothetical protein